MNVLDIRILITALDKSPPSPGPCSGSADQAPGHGPGRRHCPVPSSRGTSVGPRTAKNGGRKKSLIRLVGRAYRIMTRGRAVLPRAAESKTRFVFARSPTDFDAGASQKNHDRDKQSARLAKKKKKVTRSASSKPRLVIADAGASSPFCFAGPPSFGLFASTGLGSQRSPLFFFFLFSSADFFFASFSLGLLFFFPACPAQPCPPSSHSPGMVSASSKHHAGSAPPPHAQTRTRAAAAAAAAQAQAQAQAQAHQGQGSQPSQIILSEIQVRSGTSGATDGGTTNGPGATGGSNSGLLGLANAAASPQPGRAGSSSLKRGRPDDADGESPYGPPPDQRLGGQEQQTPSQTLLPDGRKRRSAAGSGRGVANLTPEQLAKKRANGTFLIYTSILGASFCRLIRRPSPVLHYSRPSRTHGVARGTGPD